MSDAIFFGEKWHELTDLALYTRDYTKEIKTMGGFYDYLYSVNRNPTSEKEVADKAPKKKSLTGGYFVFCNDCEGTLRRLIEAIGKHGNVGHSYEIVLDPDSKEEQESFFWDGDGSDRVESVIAIPEGEGKENVLIRMCLQTLDSINMQAKEASRKERKEWEEPPPTEEEREQILNNIIHDSHIILKGANYVDNPRRNLSAIKEYCENDIQGLKDGRIKDLTVQEVLEHVKKIADEGLEKGITFLS